MSLENAEWWEYARPFRHFRAKRALTDEAYQRVASKFKEISTASRTDGKPLLEKRYENYDALMLSFNEHLAHSFCEIFGEQQLRFLAGLIGMPFVPRIVGALHSSPANSRTGWIHTDYCVVWFDECRSSLSPITFPDSSTCDYFTGRAKSPSARPVPYVRAAAMIYYLCNDGWSQPDGGQTALYSTIRGDGSSELISPLNNSILFFECCPHSYHRFIANPGRERNSLILWLHLPVSEAESRWGPPNRQPQ
jgi:hypothetical protein